MRMIEIDYEAQPPIDGYGPGGFRVAGEWQEGGLLLLPNGQSAFAGQIDETFEQVIASASQLDVLLIGQGAEIAALPRPLRTRLEAAEIGYEVMSTPSACRTYNVLLTEDRRVGAVLMPV